MSSKAATGEYSRRSNPIEATYDPKNTQSFVLDTGGGNLVRLVGLPKISRGHGSPTANGAKVLMECITHIAMAVEHGLTVEELRRKSAAFNGLSEKAQEHILLCLQENEFASRYDVIQPNGTARVAWMFV